MKTLGTRSLRIRQAFGVDVTAVVMTLLLAAGLGACAPAGRSPTDAASSGASSRAAAASGRVTPTASAPGSTATSVAAAASPTAEPLPTGGTPSDVPQPSASVSAPPVGSPETAPPSASLVWSQLEIGQGPSPRTDHTWTVSGIENAAYLFGGAADDGPSDELWRFDLATDEWQRLEPSGARPAARFGHVAAWMDGFGLVVWSGQAGTRFFADVWAFDPGTGAWRELASSGEPPAARYGSCAAVGPDGRLWISHGFTSDGRFDDTRAYDPASGTWTDETPSGEGPIRRCLHDCFWTADGAFALYAGQTDGRPALADLWTLRPGEGWTERPQPDVPARQLYALATDGETAIVAGGLDADGRPLGDAYAIDAAGRWSSLDTGEPPPARSGATMVSDAARDRWLLFGGTARSGRLDDVWQLSPT